MPGFKERYKSSFFPIFIFRSVVAAVIIFIGLIIFLHSEWYIFLVAPLLGIMIYILQQKFLSREFIIYKNSVFGKNPGVGFDNEIEYYENENDSVRPSGKFKEIHLFLKKSNQDN